MNPILTLSNWGRRLNKQLLRPVLKPKKTWVTNRWNIVRGDFVEVIQGPNAGERGKVMTVMRAANRVIIENVNMRKRTIRSQVPGQPGRSIIRPCSLHYSNIMLIDPTTDKPTKISLRFLEDGTKVRVSRTSGQVIPKPIESQERRTPRSTITGPKDTEAVDVFKVTFGDYEKYLPFIYKARAK